MCRIRMVVGYHTYEVKRTSKHCYVVYERGDLRFYLWYSNGLPGWVADNSAWDRIVKLYGADPEAKIKDVIAMVLADGPE